MGQHFGDLEGVETDIYDIIMHAETEVKLGHRLHAVLERCEKINLQCNELNRGHPTFFGQSQDKHRTKESEFVHFRTNHRRGTCGEKLFISINEKTTKYSLLGATKFQN